MQPYRIYVMQYARRQTNSGVFFLGDTHNTPMEMAYYMWAIRNEERTVVVDLGFTRAVGEARGRTWVAEPAARLETLGIDPKQVNDVILTHMHYDHVGNYALFPNASFWVQDDEMAFWTGRHAATEMFRHSMEVDDVVALVRLNYDRRLRFVRGSQELFPGIAVHRVGGHTAGMQIVTVATASGTAVLASDASHHYGNIERRHVFPTLNNIPEMLDAFDTIERCAGDKRLIVPGHDPDVLKRFPLVEEGLAVVE